MAASTSTAATLTDNYYYSDVFINHRGPDVKKTFASHLYRRLLSHGLRAFLDQPELQPGDYFISQIEGTIRNASVHVAIFSPRYAESEWCLDELLLMLKTGAPIIPVFYGVEPSELRWTRVKTGVYGQALHDLEKKTTYDSQTQTEKPRYDSATIENWRDALSHVADISGLSLKAFNGDEGELLDKVVENVLKRVKRTHLNVAKYPTGLDEKVNDFENTLLLEQQMGKVQVVGITGLGGVGKTTLAKEIFNRKSSIFSKTCFLSDVRENAKTSIPSLQRQHLKGLIHLDLHIDNSHQGIEMLQKHLSSSQVLIVLDDVDHVDQVDALLTVHVLRPGSLVLITSRDKDVLRRSGVIAEVRGIKILASKDKHSDAELTSSSCKKRRKLQRLDMRKLHILDIEESGHLERFLRKVHFPNLIWLRWVKCCSSSLPSWIPLKNLRGNKLETVWESESQVPLQLRELKIGARISEFPKHIGKLKYIERIYLHLKGENNVETLREEFCNLRSLKALVLRGWSKLKSLPDSFGNLTNLQQIDLSGSSELGRLPNSFQNLIRLKSLNLYACSNLTISSKTLGNIRTLENVNLCSTEKIEVLPPQIARQQFLEGLYLEGTNLKELPSAVGDLIHLEILRLGSPLLETLPPSLGELKSLKELKIWDCRSLKCLPDSIGSLNQLTEMTVEDCPCSGLEELCGIEQCTSLEKLGASGCPRLQWGEGVLEHLSQRLKEFDI
eukprot:PITA_01215